MGLLQYNGYNGKSTSVPGTPINQHHLRFDDDEGSDIGNHTVGYLGGSTRAAKDDEKASTPCLESLLQLEITSDISIISWFSDVYMLDSTALFVNEMGTETTQIFALRSVVDSAATVHSYLNVLLEMHV